MGGTKPAMVVLNSANYALWKTKMMDRLNVKKLSKPIKLQGVKPNTMDDEEWEELDTACLGYIRDYIATDVMYHVEKTETAYECWQKLRELYGRKTSMVKMRLSRQLCKMQYVDGQPLTEHLSKMEHIFN